MDIERGVATHYYTRPDLETTILDALRQSGKDPDHLTPEDLSPIDEFHLGWHPQTVAFAEALGLIPGMAVLDVGAGLGGPARHFAAAHGCDVTGIDLSPAFTSVATTLSARTGLGDRTHFLTGSALEMPFDAPSFDVATLIHVGMNVANKAALFAAVRRVLRPGGRFGLFEVMQTGPGDIPMPMPWADSDATSFVATPAIYRDLLTEVGFTVTGERDRTDFVLDLARAMRERAATQGLPILGLHLVIGPTAKDRVGRLIECLDTGLLAPVEMIAEVS